MKKTIIASILAGTMALSHGATSFVDVSTVITSINYSNNNGNETGTGGGSNNYTAAFNFNVDDILTNESITLGDLATRTFTLTLEAIDNAGILSGGANDYLLGINTGSTSDVLPSSGGNATAGSANWVSAVNSMTFTGTGVADAVGTQTLTLSGISLATSAAGEKIVMGLQYDTAGVGQVASIGTAVLTLDPVPEPSSTALLGLGGLALILRRRK